MLIDVGGTIRNLVLNGCFYVIAVAAVFALIPWGFFGAEKVSRALRWLFPTVLCLALIYEVAMPSSYDIRVDLFLLLPLYAIAATTSLIRWVAWKRKDAKAHSAA